MTTEYLTPNRYRESRLPPPVLKQYYSSDSDSDSDEEEIDARRRLRYYKRKEVDSSDEERVIKKKFVQTEDLGKTFERAICDTYQIPYQGKYKYGSPPPKLKQRLQGLRGLFGECRHTADKGSRYDFTSDSGYLSAKTSKQKIGKVCPQVVGQSSLNKFRIIFGIDEDVDIKQYIQSNILTILPILEQYTFDCNNVYYNQHKDTLQHIIQKSPIDWDAYSYQWTRPYEEWTNSTTLKANGIPILEVQIHTKNRKNLAIRWYYDNLLALFKDNFTITSLE